MPFLSASRRFVPIVMTVLTESEEQTMSTLYLREQGSKLGCHGRRLVVTKEKQQLFEAPIHRFQRVVLVGHVQVTSHAAALLLDQQVPLVQTTTTGRLRGVLNPPDSHHVELRKKQYRLTDEPLFADPFRRNLVTAKAGNMISVLRRYAYNHEDKTVLEHVARIKDYSAFLAPLTNKGLKQKIVNGKIIGILLSLLP